jgi:hypothetical protein
MAGVGIPRNAACLVCIAQPVMRDRTRAGSLGPSHKTLDELSTVGTAVTGKIKSLTSG